MQLPLECIESILDQLEVWDLFPLLTVNSVLFHASATRLYANPIRFFKRFDDYHKTEAARYQAAWRLLTLVIRYSPAQDPDVQSLRLSLSRVLKALPEKPTVDYLSLIKTFHYDERSFGFCSAEALRQSLWLISTPQCIKKNLYDVLVWAACGHRLFGMLDIELLWHYLDRYHCCMDNMTSMPSIRLHLPVIWDEDTAYPILNDVLHFMEKWAEANTKLEKSRHHPPIMQLMNGYYPDWPTDAPRSQILQRIFALMSTSTLTEINTRRHLEWIRFIKAPETIDLSCVRTFVSDLADRTSWPEGVDMTTILQQFRNLRRLELNSSTFIDYDLFQWACEERQRIAPTTTSTSSTGAYSLVPLSELQLTFTLTLPWQSAIYGFGATLAIIQVDAGLNGAVDLCAFHDMPSLQFLDLSIYYIVDSGSAIPFSGCPRLESLALSCSSDGQAAWDSREDLRMLLNLLGDVALDYKGPRQKFDPWDLPRLKRLTLNRLLCYRFHQETLRTMGKLEYLNFNDRYDYYKHPEDGPFKWNMCDWTHASFPQLKELHLHGYPARTFAWSMLDQCPALQHLDLGNFRLEKRVKLDSKLWPWPLTPHPNILRLAMTGFDISEQQQPHVFDLAQAMPNLITVELYNCIHVDSSLQRMLEAKLPWLKNIHLSIDKPRSALYY